MKKYIVIALLVIVVGFVAFKFMPTTKAPVGDAVVPTGETAVPDGKRGPVELNLPEGWSIYEQDVNKIVLNASYRPGAATYLTLYLYSKRADETLQGWLNSNVSKIPTGYGKQDECSVVKSSAIGDIYDCDFYAQNLFFVDQKGTSIIANFGGQDPIITPSQMLALVSPK